MLTGWCLVNLVWICRFVELREFYFLSFSPECAQELTLAQGPVCWLISVESASHPSPSLLAAELLLSLQCWDRLGRERWQQCCVCTSIDAQQPHMGQNEPEDLPSFDEFICSHFLLCLLQEMGGVFRWELMILQAAVIEGKLRTRKSKPGSVLSEPGKQWNDVLQTCAKPFFSGP